MARRFYAWFDRRNASAIAPVEAALRERETTLIRFDPALGEDRDAALVVFLSDALLASAAEELDAVLARWPRPPVLVALAPISSEAPEAVERLSWIKLDPEDDDPIGAAAGRIALSGRVTPEWLLSWQEIRVAADLLRAGDRSAALDQGELDRALETVSRRPSDILAEVPPAVAELLEESRRSLRHRRRRRIAVALAAAVIMIGVGLVALAQRNSATAAREGAESAARHSEADRLARLAGRELDADPDLPVLLARRAYQLDPGPDARASLRQALDASPWHRSYRLEVAAVQVAGSQYSRFVAVVGEDGSVALLDSGSGRVLVTVARPHDAEGVPIVAVSGDGRRLGLAYEGGMVEVRRLDRGFELVRTRRLAGLRASAPRSLAWLGGRRLLVAWDGLPAQILDLRTGSAERLDVGIAEPHAIAVASEGRLVAVSGRDGIAILRRPSLRPCWREAKRMPDGVGLAFDERRNFLYVAREFSPGMQVPVPGRCGVHGEQQPELRSMIWSYGDAATALPGGGIASGDITGEVVLLEPPASYPAGRFRAHQTRVTGIAVAEDGLVTVGDDGWLRVWHPPSMPVYPLGPPWLVSYYEDFGAVDTRGTWRPMIVSNTAGTRVVVGSLPNGGVAVLRPDRLAEPLDSAFIAFTSSLRPAAAEPCAVLQFNGSATLHRCTGEGTRSVWSHRVSEAASLFETALSADARFVAFAGLGSVAVAQVPKGPSDQFDFGELDGLGFDRHDRLFAFSHDGTVLEVPREGDARRVAVPLGDCRPARAEVLPSGRRALLLCEEGQLVLADMANGGVVARFEIETDLSDAIGVRFSPSGRLAVIVGSAGYRVVDLRLRRLIATGGRVGDDELGREVRDATFVGNDRTLLVLRADGGVVRVRLASWRLLTGDQLLGATEIAAPRSLREGEVAAVARESGGS